MKMRVADYIAKHLEEIGVKCVFMLSGGGMMHLIDAAGRVNMEYVCNHHEQASAMAAEGYARQSGNLGVCYATSGPGGTNTITGIVGAWQDSAPILVLTGQSRVSQTIQGSGIEGLRQFGTFEVDIVPIVKSITKYAHFLDDPKTARYHLEKAIWLAMNGRPGPVLLDIPLDVQGALIDPDELRGFNAMQEGFVDEAPALSEELVDEIVERLRNAKRPLILAGHGVRAAGAVELFRRVVRELNVPVITTALGQDVLPYDDALFVGHPGVRGDRAGNFAVQCADVLLTIGTSLHATTTGYELDRFAPDAFKIQVELDAPVLQKENVGVQLKVRADVATFLEKLAARIEPVASSTWHERLLEWKTRFAVMNEPHKTDGDEVNYFSFVDKLSEVLEGQETVVTDAGSAYYVVGQAFRAKPNQRVIVSGALGSMGYAVPAALGVCTADRARNVICITGDGSLQTNIQELQTIRHNNFNLKLFIVSNDGYVSIRNTQDNYFSGHYVGSSQDSGVSVPPLDKIADAYGLPYIACRAANLEEAIRQTLATPGPVVCEVFNRSDQELIPLVQSVRLENGSMQSKPLHEMSPLLDDDTLAQILNVETASV